MMDITIIKGFVVEAYVIEIHITRQFGDVYRRRESSGFAWYGN